ncbi:MAG: XdhC/CoxI family protein [Desulfocapsaceae bacterium]|nr:XdhC/CoxI family protein [Desulfocapsaceae bacterium]
MDLKIYEEMALLSRTGVSFALATVIDHSGSSPRKAGAKMLLRGNGTILGSIGGGRVEAETIEAAKAALVEGTPRTLPFVLTEKHGFACGGSMTVYVEPHGNAPRLVLFGAGHVGKATAVLAKSCGFRVTVVDERPEYANQEAIPCADELLCCQVEEAFTGLRLDSNSFVVIATPGHLHDFVAVQGALKSEAGFIGLVGSRRKKQALLQTLTENGFTEEELARVITPVGVEIDAETPEEIAVSIVGQLIQKRRRHDTQRRSNPTGCRSCPAHGEL